MNVFVNAFTMVWIPPAFAVRGAARYDTSVAFMFTLLNSSTSLLSSSRLRSLYKVQSVNSAPGTVDHTVF